MPRLDRNELVLLPNTDELRAQAESAETRLAAAAPGTNQHSMLAREVEWTRKRLAWGEQRDAIHAERPDGCWCLGTGGRVRRFITTEAWGFDVYCDCAEGVAARAAAERVTREREQAQRQRWVAQCFQQAAIPARFVNCTFDSFPRSEVTREAVQRVRDWQAVAGGPEDEDEWGRWFDARKESLLLYGPYGTGKTGLAVAALQAGIADDPGDSYLFITVPALLDRIRQTYGPGAALPESEVLQAVKSVSFLVLDDLGAERVSDWVQEKLFTIINHRHDEKLTTIFTSNLTIEELGAHIGERTTWRICEMAEIIELAGPNLRAKAMDERYDRTPRTSE